MDNQFKELREQAQELLDFGNSKEKAEGRGMLTVIDALENNSDSAKQTLKDCNYYTDNLWSVSDVQGKFKCTVEQAQKVLDKSLTNEATMEQIWLSIDTFGEMFGLEKIETE